MRNPEDYAAGWTTATLNPRTGKRCSGGAARNLKTAQMGGAVGIQNDGFIKGVQFVQPVVERLEAQLEKSNKLLQKVTTALTAHSKLVSKKSD